MIDEQKINTHKGHRARLLKTINQAGLNNLSEIQVLEYILTFTIPRGDTNPLAHSLLEKYGSVSKVIDANYFSLLEVKGIGERSAKMLTTLPEIFDFYKHDKLKNTKYIKLWKDVYDYFTDIYDCITNEQVIVAFINKQGCFVGYKKISEGSLSDVSFDTNLLTRNLLAYNGNSVMIAHNHPTGSAVASQQDAETFNKLVNLFMSLRISIDDFIVVGNDGVYSAKLHGLIPHD